MINIISGGGGSSLSSARKETAKDNTNAARNNKLLRRYSRSHRLLAALLRPCSKLFMLKLWLFIKFSFHHWSLFGYSPEDMVASNTVWSCNWFLICAQRMQPWLPLPMIKNCYHENSASFGTFIIYKYISTQVLSLFILSLSIITFLIVLIILSA